jgi:tripartite-type tricarboxylate transporter receptor subunit TctC
MKLAANLFASLLLLLAAQTASAQSSYPNRPVKILVGFTPGTAPDLAARILADRFSEVWGTPFVVENIPGAGSNIATERVAKAAADGHTLLMGGNPALVINPSLYETLPFDPLKDFAPISQVFVAANVLAVPLGAGARPADHGGIRLPRPWRCRRCARNSTNLASSRSATRRPSLPRSSRKKRLSGQK